MFSVYFYSYIIQYSFPYSFFPYIIAVMRNPYILGYGTDQDSHLNCLLESGILFIHFFA